MGKTVGQEIQQARKRKGWTIDDVAPLIGKSRSLVSMIERDALKGGPDAETVAILAEALGSPAILYAYLENNPVYRSVIPRIFPEMNNIRRDPAIIFTRLGREMAEGKDACDILAEVFSNADPRASVPRFDEILRAQMEQIIDVKRGVEILELQLVASKVMSEADRQEIYHQQQEKCIRKGHHKPESVASEQEV